MAPPAHHVDFRTHVEILGVGTLLQGEAPGRRFGGCETLRVGEVTNQFDSRTPSSSVSPCTWRIRNSVIAQPSGVLRMLLMRSN